MSNIPFKVGKVQDHHEAIEALKEFGHEVDSKNTVLNDRGDIVFSDEVGCKVGVMTSNNILSVYNLDK